MKCSYSNTIAIKYGINAALIASYIKKQLKTTSVCVNDVMWVRLPIRNLTGVFPFMGEWAARHAIKKLRKGNIIFAKQLGKEHFDHAYFYTLTPYGQAVNYLENEDSRNRGEKPTMR